MVWNEFDTWTGPRIVIEREVDLCSGSTVSFAVEEYCSYCREDWGRHTHRGSHSSSHDSKRRYLSDAKINT
jgi:hypothetical protein